MELEEPIKQMKVIHVAGTKGKVRSIACVSSFALYIKECDNLFKYGRVVFLPIHSSFTILYKTFVIGSDFIN